MVFGRLRKGGPGVLALALPDSATAALEDVGFAEPTVEAYYCVQGVIGYRFLPSKPVLYRFSADKLGNLARMEKRDHGRPYVTEDYSKWQYVRLENPRKHDVALSHRLSLFLWHCVLWVTTGSMVLFIKGCSFHGMVESLVSLFSCSWQKES